MTYYIVDVEVKYIDNGEMANHIEMCKYLMYHGSKFRAIILYHSIIYKSRSVNERIVI